LNGSFQDRITTMRHRVDYYFSLVSPWAYIGHRVFEDIASRHDLKVNYKPVALARVFEQTGGLPLPKRHPVRQRYRIMELQRWRDKRGLAFRLHPRFWPFDADLADRFVIAACAAGLDPVRFLGNAFAAIWEGERNLAEPEVIAEIGGEAGLPGSALLDAARDAETAAAYAQNVRDAIAAGAFGSPCFVLDGEVFWGQDRLELLDDALASGRRPYGAEA
jgi:2-hydroxychromene-2-carboxylate isomerase